MIEYLTNLLAALTLAALSSLPVMVAFWFAQRSSSSRFDTAYNRNDYEPDYHPRGCMARRRTSARR